MLRPLLSQVPPMATTLVNGLCATILRPLLHRDMAVGKIKSCWPTRGSPSVALHVNGSSFKMKSSLSTKEFEDGGPPRWFSPLESGRRLTGSPLLLFLPGLSLSFSLLYMRNMYFVDDLISQGSMVVDLV